MKFTFETKGLKELQRKLKKTANLNQFKDVVRFNGDEMEERIRDNAEFRGHFEWVAGKGMVFKRPTGETKRSITSKLSNGGFTVEAGPTMEYAEYVEFGTRFMEAQPFVKPAFDVQKKQFESDMKNLVR